MACSAGLLQNKVQQVIWKCQDYFSRRKWPNGDARPTILGLKIMYYNAYKDVPFLHLTVNVFIFGIPLLGIFVWVAAHGQPVQFISLIILQCYLFPQKYTLRSLNYFRVPFFANDYPHHVYMRVTSI